MSRTLIKAYLSLDGRDWDLDAPCRSLDWWLKLRQTHPNPTQKDIDFRCLRGWHDSITICEVMPDCSDMTIGLYGEKVRNLFLGLTEQETGHDFAKGLKMSQVLKVDPSEQQRHIRTIIDPPRVAYTFGYVTLQSGRELRVRAFDYPLQPLPGGNYHIITFYEPDGRLSPGEATQTGLHILDSAPSGPPAFTKNLSR